MHRQVFSALTIHENFHGMFLFLLGLINLLEEVFVSACIGPFSAERSAAFGDSCEAFQS